MNKCDTWIPKDPEKFKELFDDDYEDDYEDDEDSDEETEEYDEELDNKIKAKILNRIIMKERDKKKPNKRKVKEKSDKMPKSQKEYEATIIHLMTRVEYIKKKLTKLNPGKKKDAKKIAELNIEMNELRILISKMESKSGIHVGDIDMGKKSKRVINKIKSKFKRIKKKVKKFCKRNKELIAGIITITVPVLSSMILGFALHI